MKHFHLLTALLTLSLVILAGGCSDSDLIGPEADEPGTIETLDTDGEVLGKFGGKIAPGEVKPILSLPTGWSPEGITVDKRGRVYIGNRRLDGPVKISEIFRIGPDGTPHLFATLPASDEDDYGVLGLISDKRGNIYAAMGSVDASVHGVWKIRRNGAMQRLAGSENMVLPNALTFDKKGNLYCTDSFGSSVWRYGKDHTFAKWIEDPLLMAVPVPTAPIPLPGANGIAFFPPNKLYVANTSQNSVSRIKIGKSGQAAGIELVAQDFLLLNVDGIAMDVRENVYGVLPPSTLEEFGVPPVPPLVKLNTHTGVVTPVVTDASLFDTPTSLVFGRGRNRRSIYVANAALFGPGLGAGPGVVQIGVDTPGLKIH